MFETTFHHLIFAFCGGCLGASIGAISAFVLFGFFLIIGSLFKIYFGDSSFLSSIAFHTSFVPYTAFVGGVAAIGYASKKSGSKIHGKEISQPLLWDNQTDSILIGGLFGIVGYLLFFILNEVLVFSFDVVALSVFLATFLARVIFCANKKWFGITQKHHQTKHHFFNLYGRFLNHVVKDSHRHWQSELSESLLIGGILGYIFSYLALVTNDALLGFGISLVLLVFLRKKSFSPVIYHIAFPASIATLASGNLLIGALFGILAAIIGEASARIFYNWGDTHVDFPTLTIFICSVLVNLVY